MEVLRAAQRLEAQFGVSVAPKQSVKRAVVVAPEASPWGPRPAPPSWELDEAISRLSETWADNQLAAVPVPIPRHPARLLRRLVSCTWEWQAGQCNDGDVRLRCSGV